MQQQDAPIVDAIDMEILMHRDAHFGSNFEMMLEYYGQDGVGVMPDFEVEEIKKLKNLEDEAGKNLSDVYLPEPAKEIVSKAQKLYQNLREAYSAENPDPLSILLSDLILSEEEVPEKEIAAIVDKGKETVPVLIHLLGSQSFYDPIFPGYGRSPIFAARCLALIQDERAIPPLFEALGQDNFFTDEEIIKALCSFGNLSKSFLFSILMKEPFSKDNEYAAIALNAFGDDEDIASHSLELLEKPEVLKRPSFASYLIFACSNLTHASEQARFIALSKKKGLLKELRDEMVIVIKNWKKTT